MRSEHESDAWSEWLLHRRHADNPRYEQAIRKTIDQCADRVLDGAQLAPGMKLADIGTGDGLMARRAIDRIGPSLSVVQTDISTALLRHAETQAAQRNVLSQCTFIHCGADNLAAIESNSVDAVVTRSVLAYVADKPAALREFHRILKPGGRLSIGEPIFQDEAFAARALKMHLDSQPPESRDRFTVLMHRWKAAQFPDTESAIRENPIVNFSERDLVRMAQSAGFPELHMQFHVDVNFALANDWEIFLGTSPHPLAPSLDRILTEQFDDAERALFEQVMRPIVENPNSIMIDRMAYLTATKPATNP